MFDTLQCLPINFFQHFIIFQIFLSFQILTLSWFSILWRGKMIPLKVWREWNNLRLFFLMLSYILNRSYKNKQKNPKPIYNNSFMKKYSKNLTDFYELPNKVKRFSFKSRISVNENVKLLLLRKTNEIFHIW